MSWFISLSSTSRILGILFSSACTCALDGDSGRSFYPALLHLSSAHTAHDHAVEEFDQLLAVVGTFQEHPLGMGTQPVELLAAEVLGGHNHDGDVPPSLLAPHCLQHLEPVHVWHHQVEQHERRTRPFQEG